MPKPYSVVAIIPHVATRIISIIACILLPACTWPPKIDLSPQASAQLKSIVVLRVPEPEKYGVARGATGSQLDILLLPLVIIAVADIRSKQPVFDKTLNEQRPLVMSHLVDKLAGQLERRGFAVKVIDGEVSGKPEELKVSTRDAIPQCDGIVVLSDSRISFLAHYFYSDYQPAVSATATLFAGDGKQVLYRRRHQSGNDTSASRAGAAFTSFDALIANPAAAAESLRDAAEVVAAAIAEDLRPESQPAESVGEK